MNVYVVICLLMVVILGVTGCGTAKNYDGSGAAVSSANQNEEDNTVDPKTTDTYEEQDETFDDGEKFHKDYSEEIYSQIEIIAEAASSIEDELSKVEDYAGKYYDLMSQAQTASEMEQVSGWQYTVWDAELNNLWSRMSNNIGADTKAEIFEEQRTWIAIKDKAVSEATSNYQAGSRGGIMEMETSAIFTRNRVYKLAQIYADHLGESFTMPARSETGMYIDNQGTADIYSDIVINEGTESDTYDVAIGLFRITTLDGTAKADGDKLFFVTDEEDTPVEGIIEYGWDGASFTVTSSGFEYIKAGDTYTFDMVM